MLFSLPSLLLFCLLLAPAPPARACPICFGESESDSREEAGTRWAAVLLGGVPYLLIAGGAVLAVRRRRAAGRPEAEQEPEEGR